MDGVSAPSTPDNSRVVWGGGQTHRYPAKMLSRVDFPAPEGPMIAVSCPGRNTPVTPSRIVFRSETPSSASRQVGSRQVRVCQVRSDQVGSGQPKVGSGRVSWIVPNPTQVRVRSQGLIMSRSGQGWIGLYLLPINLMKSRSGTTFVGLGFQSVGSVGPLIAGGVSAFSGDD